jgi:hypothetical protein
VGKARGGKDSQKVGSDYHFVLGPLFLGMPLPWGFALHTWKKKEKKKKKGSSSNFANFQP